MANNGVVFTCIYSTESMAEKAINGCKGLNIKKISANKPDFWKSLLANGIIQIVADNSPVTLTVQEWLTLRRPNESQYISVKPKELLLQNPKENIWAESQNPCHRTLSVSVQDAI